MKEKYEIDLGTFDPVFFIETGIEINNGKLMLDVDYEIFYNKIIVDAMDSSYRACKVKQLELLHIAYNNFRIYDKDNEYYLSDMSEEVIKEIFDDANSFINDKITLSGINVFEIINDKTKYLDSLEFSEFMEYIA